jgi:Glycine-rich domain-containing protein-like
MQLSTTEFVDNAKKHIAFLKELHTLGVTTTLPNRECIRRYEELWLPLVIKCGNSKELIPPPDIAWLWHCHRLAPKHYTKYIKDTYGENCTIEAYLPFVFQTPELTSEDEQSVAMVVTRQIWKEFYPDDNFFPYNFDTSTSDEESLLTTTTKNDMQYLVGSFDLIASAQRQATFLWQVSGERFEDDDFLEEGVSNYKKFLKLRSKARKQGVILVPTYQIDLFWHTHILVSIQQYDKDCLEVIGETLHHDDSLTDRSDGGVLHTSYKATCNLWKQEYGCDYAVSGGMYRGEPPPDYYSSEWKAWNCLDDWLLRGNLHLIGKTGASSTAPPKAWANIHGLTSDGSQAFIPTRESSRFKLRNKSYKANYILGKTSNGVGYFHLETRDAQEILYTRARHKIESMESDIACRRACCRGNARSTKKLERDLLAMRKVETLLLERLNAPQPWGTSNTKRSEHSEQSSYVAADGAWLYPPFLYYTAGGACGGDVIWSGGACGGSACGGKYTRKKLLLFPSFQ